jgi:hypothetical protein
MISVNRIGSIRAMEWLDRFWRNLPTYMRVRPTFPQSANQILHTESDAWRSVARSKPTDDDGPHVEPSNITPHLAGPGSASWTVPVKGDVAR